MVILNMVLPRVVSMWQGMLRRHMIWLVWLVACSEMDNCYTIGASNIYYKYNISTTSRVPTSYPSTVPAAHDSARAGYAFFNYFDDALMSSGHVRARVVAPSLNTSPRSPVSVLRSSQPWADCRLFLRPAAEPMTFRPAAAATSAPPFLLRGSATAR